ncbi:hypothetical protein SNEBB_007578 [Seison nebaliae]|nr:hypothetical protein SNEBB_007578 [Seison nebaliae]
MKGTIVYNKVSDERQQVSVMNKQYGDPETHNADSFRNRQNRYDDGDQEPSPGQGACGLLLIGASVLVIIATFPVTIWLCIKIIKEYERAVIFRLGRLTDGRAKGPGLFFIIPCADSYVSVDLRTVTFDVAPQEILTRDSVTVTVDAVVYFRIFDAVTSVTNVEDAARATKLLAATTLRNELGCATLQEILAEREKISQSLREQLDRQTDPWGIKVELVEIKDVRLPMNMQRAMAAEAEASRDAKAKIIAADGEFKASKSLKEAADVISQSGTALQLRYLQTLTTISAEKNSTIIFPIPMEMMKGLHT